MREIFLSCSFCFFLLGIGTASAKPTTVSASRDCGEPSCDAGSLYVGNGTCCPTDYPLYNTSTGGCLKTCEPYALGVLSSPAHYASGCGDPECGSGNHYVGNGSCCPAGTYLVDIGGCGYCPHD